MSARAAHASAHASFGGEDPLRKQKGGNSQYGKYAGSLVGLPLAFFKNICANAKHLLARFGNQCDLPLRSSGITRSPHQENKEEARKYNECYKYQKSNRGRVGNR